MLLASRTTNSHLPQLPCFSSLSLSVHHFCGAQGGSHRILIVPHSVLPQYCKCQHQCNTYPQNDRCLCPAYIVQKIRTSKVLLTDFIDELHYTKAKERSHMDAGNDGTCSFPLSAFLFPSSSRHLLPSCEGNG